MSQAGQSRRVTRRARLEEPRPSLEEIEARIASPDDPDIADDLEGGAGPSPEEALEAARASEAAKDKQLKAERARADAAELDAARAKQASGNTALENLKRSEDKIKSDVAAAASAKEAAAEKYQRARDSGDTKAETEALGEMTDASAQLTLAKATEVNFNNWKTQNADKIRRLGQPPQRQTQQTDEDGPSPEAQRWIGQHPLFKLNTEDGAKYRAEAEAAHDLALADLGRDKEGTDEYVAFIDKHMESIYGKGHGQIDHGNGKGRQQMDNRNQNRNASTAAPRGEGDRSRRNANGRSVGRDGRTELVYEHEDGSTLRLVNGVDSNGKPYETVVGNIPADWREYARVAGFKGEQGLLKYAVEQIKIQDEQQNGGPSSGLASQRDGVYR